VDVRWLGTVEYLRAWEIQKARHAEVLAGDAPDTLLLLEHPSVYTAGKRTQPEDRPIGSDVPVVEVDRGGRITWHGPGQLVGYPFVRLDGPDVVAHVRRLEELLIRVCAAYGVDGERVEGRSGVWVRRPLRPDAKVAAIGVRVARGVTMHGFALNADCDLSAYDAIVPCGIADAGVTSLSQLTGRAVRVADVLPLVADLAPAVLSRPLPAPVS
jgi:lipoyl(octanoyl) transferase